MTTDFLHGIRTIEVTDGARPIQIVRSAVIALIGTAKQGPDMAFIKGSRTNAVDLFGPADSTATIPSALDGIFDQTGALVIVINVCDPEKHISSYTTSGLIIPNRLNRATLPHTHVSDVVITSLDDATTYQVGVDYKLDQTTGLVTRTEGSTLPVGEAVKASYMAVDPTKVTLSDVIGAATGTGFTGCHLLRAAQSRYGVVPRILCAPGFTHSRPVHPTLPSQTVQNPVVAELVSLAERLRAVVIADGPNTTDEAAIIARNDSGSGRHYIVENWPIIQDIVTDTMVVEPPSARVAGMIARSDSERGFWWSPSNTEMLGISGLSRDVDWSISDANCAANVLNEQEVAVMIRQPGAGFKLWGNRSCSSEPLLAFLPVRRTLDMVYESLEQGLIWSMDRPISPQTIEDLEGTINAFLRDLKVRGALLGGEAWLPRDLNSVTNLQAGKVAMRIKLEPPAPMETLTLYVHRNADYYLESLSDFLKDQ